MDADAVCSGDDDALLPAMWAELNPEVLEHIFSWLFQIVLIDNNRNRSTGDRGAHLKSRAGRRMPIDAPVGAVLRAGATCRGWWIVACDDIAWRARCVKPPDNNFLTLMQGMMDQVATDYDGEENVVEVDTVGTGSVPLWMLAAFDSDCEIRYREWYWRKELAHCEAMRVNREEKGIVFHDDDEDRRLAFKHALCSRCLAACRTSSSSSSSSPRLLDPAAAVTATAIGSLSALCSSSPTRSWQKYVETTEHSPRGLLPCVDASTGLSASHFDEMPQRWPPPYGLWTSGGVEQLELFQKQKEDKEARPTTTLEGHTASSFAGPTSLESRHPSLRRRVSPRRVFSADVLNVLASTPVEQHVAYGPSKVCASLVWSPMLSLELLRNREDEPDCDFQHEDDVSTEYIEFQRQRHTDALQNVMFSNGTLRRCLMRPLGVLAWRHVFAGLSRLADVAPFSIYDDGIEAVMASSVDHPRQGPSCVLDANPEKFWSSTGSADRHASDFLIFSWKWHLVQPERFSNSRPAPDLPCIQSVSIRPFCAQFQQGEPVYAPQAWRVLVGFKQQKMREESSTDASVLWHWQSDIMPYIAKAGASDKTNTQQLNILDLSNNSGEIVVGDMVAVVLLGRTEKQPSDDLYYNCLERVHINYVPVSALASGSDHTLALASAIVAGPAGLWYNHFTFDDHHGGCSATLALRSLLDLGGGVSAGRKRNRPPTAGIEETAEMQDPSLLASRGAWNQWFAANNSDSNLLPTTFVELIRQFPQTARSASFVRALLSASPVARQSWAQVMQDIQLTLNEDESLALVYIVRTTASLTESVSLLSRIMGEGRLALTLSVGDALREVGMSASGSTGRQTHTQRLFKLMLARHYERAHAQGRVIRTLAWAGEFDMASVIAIHACFRPFQLLRDVKAHADRYSAAGLARALLQRLVDGEVQAVDMTTMSNTGAGRELLHPLSLATLADAVEAVFGAQVHDHRASVEALRRVLDELATSMLGSSSGAANE